MPVFGDGGLCAQGYDAFGDEPPPVKDILPSLDDGIMDEPGDPLPEPLPPEQIEAIPASTLRIVSWDLSEAPNVMPAPRTAAQPATPWRTSFGSERHGEVATGAAPAKDALVPDADVVLLQGVSDVPALRRLFPPRQWRLAISRRALPAFSTAALATSSHQTALPVQMTAVAIRARRGLRITGREPTLELAIAQAPAGSTASATAVRIADGNRTLWLLSVVLAETCTVTNAQCAEQSRIAEWAQGKRSGGEATIIGGHFTSAKSSTPGASGAPPPVEPCRHQTIDGANLDGASPTSVTGAKKDGVGCMALAELPPS